MKIIIYWWHYLKGVEGQIKKNYRPNQIELKIELKNTEFFKYG